MYIIFIIFKHMGCCCIRPQLIQQTNKPSKDYLIPQSFTKKNKLIQEIKIKTHEQIRNQPVYDKKKADENKEQGNQYFSKGEYYKAIQCYNEAIVDFTVIQLQFPFEIDYYNNRSLAYRRLGNWEKCLNSVNQGLKIDKQNQKCLIYYACSLAQVSKSSQTAKQKLILLNKSRLVLLKLIQTDSKFRKQEQESLKKLDQLQKLYKRQEVRQSKKQFLNYFVNKVQKLNKLPCNLQKVYLTNVNLVQQLSKFIQKSEILEECPEYFQDPISYEIYRKPYLSISGISYQKQLLTEHILKNGNTDPMTKQDMTINQPIENKDLLALISKQRRVTKWRVQQTIVINPKFINF